MGEAKEGRERGKNKSVRIMEGEKIEGRDGEEEVERIEKTGKEKKKVVKEGKTSGKER